MIINRAIKRLHLRGIYRMICMFLVNRVFIGTAPLVCGIKRGVLRSIGFRIGANTTIVGPLFSTGKVEIGDNCWIGKNMTVNGNGTVVIGNNCDIAPEVIFNTGGHRIGDAFRRAGKGEIYTIKVGDGTWIGARATVIRNTTIGSGCVIAACACVASDVKENTLVGGVPAKVIREFNPSNGNTEYNS